MASFTSFRWGSNDKEEREEDTEAKERVREYDEVMKDKPDLGCEKEIYDVAYFALEFSAVVMHFSR